MSSQESRYRRAEELIAEGRYSSADALLELTAQEAPRAAQSLYLWGVVRLLQRRTAEARLLIDRAFSLKRWIKDVPPDVVDLEPVARAAVDAMPDWAWPRYEVERRAFTAIGFTLANVVRSRLARGDVRFVQVGANDGASSKDPIHRFVVAHQWSGVCVEPVPQAFERLSATYADNPRVRLANVAIDENDGVRPMYLPADRDTTLASLLPGRNILAKTRDVRTIDVRCVTFPHLCAEYGVSAVDVLQIDTEGYDYYVLRSFELARFRPAVVNLELFCLPLDERLACFRLLRQHGYAYRYDGKDLLAIDRAVLGAELCVFDRTGGTLLPAASTAPTNGWPARARRRWAGLAGRPTRRNRSGTGRR
jgi:FkbM family methyltransferase